MTQTDKPSSLRTWFIADAPLSDADRDAFGHWDVANNLLTMLREPHRGRRMIGLLGQFGVGKSSVIELLGKLLSGDNDHSLIRVSAERHEIENFHRSFVFSVAEAIVDRGLASRTQVENIISRLEYSTTQSWSDFRLSGVGRLITLLGSRLRSKLGKLLIAVGSIAFLVLGVVTLILLANDFFATDTVSRTMAWIATLIGSIATTLTAVPMIGLFKHAAKQADPLKPGQSTSLRPRAEAADEYERVFASLVELVKSRLVIAVDDVDRLDQREILTALNAIRSFQLTVPAKKQPTFIVSLDDTIIAQALVAQRQEHASIDQDGADVLIDEYLNRLFTLRQSMPLHAKRDLRSYARDLLVSTNHRGAEKLGTSFETVLNVLVHDEVQSPRHVIRLLNAFFADYRLANQRELSDKGKRAISSGLVTSAPAVLARMTVLKNDFPTFFGALVVDTRLLGEVENDVRGALDPVESEELAAKTGFAADSPAYSSLKRFIGRTATWTEPIGDLLPFLYLGQDSLERSVGSADARRALSALSNRQIAEFDQLLDDAVESSEKQREAYIESIVDATRALEGLELANALATIAENATKSSELSLSISDAFADGIVRAPATHLSTNGLSTMLGAVSSEQHRAEIIRALSKVPNVDELRREWTTSVLDNDSKLTPYPHALANVQGALLESLSQSARDGHVDELETYASRLRTDSNMTITEMVLSSTLKAFVQSEHDLTDSFASNAGKAATSLSKHALSDDLGKSISAALASGPTTNGALAALRIVEAVDLNDAKQLANLSHAYLRGATIATRDGLADGFEYTHFEVAIPVLISAARIAHGYTSPWGKNVKVSIPRQIAEVLALSIDQWNTIYPSGNALADALLQVRPQSVGSVIHSAARLLSSATEMVDEDEQVLLESILSNAENLAEADVKTLREALSQALSINAEDGLRTQTIALLPSVRDNAAWGPWIEQLIVKAAAAANHNLATCEAAAAVTLAASPEIPTSTSAEAVYDLVRTKMLPYRYYSLAVHIAGSFAWPDDYRTKALEEIAPILGEGEDPALEAAFSHLGGVERGGISDTAVAHFHALVIEKPNLTTGPQVLRHLSLDVAFQTVLSLGQEAQQPMLEALNAALDSESATFVEGVPATWAANASSTPFAATLLTAFANLHETQYVKGTTELVSDFMTNDDTVLFPERLGEILEACVATVQPVAELISLNIEGAAHEVLTATKLLPAIGTSTALDKELAAAASTALWRWSREQVDVDVSSSLAKAMRSGNVTRSAALKTIGPRGPRAEPAKSIYLTVRNILM